MPTGATLLAILEAVRHETGLSPRLGEGTDSLAGWKRKLRRAQNVYYGKYDWPHLRVTTTKTLSAGSRYYDLPTSPAINFDRVEKVWTSYGGDPYFIERGIDEPSHYAAHDSVDDERSDPVERWDLRNVSGSEQIEVWPIPATAGTLYIRGFKALGAFVDEADTADLDDDLLALTVASEIISDAKPQRSVRLAAAAADLYNTLTTNPVKGRKASMLGNKGRRGQRPYHAVIRVT